MNPEPTTPPVAPAGWYRDPLGLPQLRWWNGFSWTNAIRAGGTAAESTDPVHAAVA